MHPVNIPGWFESLLGGHIRIYVFLRCRVTSGVDTITGEYFKQVREGGHVDISSVSALSSAISLLLLYFSVSSPLVLFSLSLGDDIK